MNYATRSMQRSVVTLVAFSALFFGFAGIALAENPVGCFSNGVGLSLAVYREDGTTPVGAGQVEPGEVVQYEATLSYLGGNNCYFDGGSLDIITPDGVPHTVASGAGIPLVTSTFVAPQQSYVVSEVDVDGGFLNALADYSDGISYTPNQNTAAADVDISTPYQDVALVVEKTAVPAAEESFRWDIEKTVTPENWDLFVGDSGTSEYTIDVDKVSVGVTYSVAGQITIDNPAQFAAAEGVDVEDTILGIGPVTVDCGVSLPTTIAAGDQLVCTYEYDLGSDDTARTNTVVVTTTGDVDGGSDDADFDPSAATPVDMSGPVEVDDTFEEGDRTGITDSFSYSYTRTFVCGDGQGEYEGTGNTVDNTAEIVETGAFDDASVEVNCYDLEVEKTAEGTYDLTWEWDIDKDADQTQLLLQEGQYFTVNYEVTVDTIGSTQTNHEVEGQITITNNHPTMDAEIVDVVDDLEGVFPAVSCPADVVPADDSIVCTYGPASSDADINEVTVTQQNYDYDETGTPTAGGTTDYVDDVAVNYTLANEVDECIDVNDTNVGFLGTVCADEAPQTFSYSLDFSTADDADVVLVCGDNEHENIADFVTNDTGTTGEDSHIVYPEVNCVIGCTLTQGYWKTHSSYGPAPYDEEGWAALGDFDTDGSDEEADEGWGWNDLTWYEAFWTPPKKGNVWYKLAHQFQAAYLNVANGAGAPTAVSDALAAAEAWLLATDPSTVPKGKNAKEANAWHSTLASFNEGEIGPGHCDEDSSSSNSF